MIGKRGNMIYYKIMLSSKVQLSKCALFSESPYLFLFWHFLSWVITCMHVLSLLISPLSSCSTLPLSFLPFFLLSADYLRLCLSNPPRGSVHLFKYISQSSAPFIVYHYISSHSEKWHLSLESKEPRKSGFEDSKCLEGKNWFHQRRLLLLLPLSHLPHKLHATP